ncbi:hypothetical protein N9937_00020 [bacterium]|nr:hypothetical protein [bacterium]
MSDFIVDSIAPSLFSIFVMTASGKEYRYTGSWRSAGMAQAIADQMQGRCDRGHKIQLDNAELWMYVRTAYGSPAWSHADEVGLMDEEERLHKGF